MVHFRKETLNKIASEYLNKVSRQDLQKKYDIPIMVLTQALMRRGIKLWDKKFEKRNDMDKICQLYKSKKFNREQLVKRYKLNPCSLYNALVRRNIKLWDEKGMDNNDKTRSRLYRIKDDKTRYAKLFYEFNK